MRVISSYFILLIIIPICIYLGSCKKFIEVDPPTDRITEVSVFQNDLTAIAAVTGIYSNLAWKGISSPDLISFSKFGGLSADEFVLWSGARDLEKAYFKNELASFPGGINAGISAGGDFWNVCYTYIFNCNQAIEQISSSSSLTSNVRQQLTGEVKFLRAYLYFYLVNLYGDIPIPTSTDVAINRLLARTDETQVYNLIVEDLKEAELLLSENYVNSGLQPSANAERIRPTKWAAKALLARVYLYNKNYSEAEIQSSSIINEFSKFDVVSLTSTFLKNSKEAIWQLQPVTEGWNTTDARWFNLGIAPMGFSIEKSIHLSSTLYNSFEEGDKRKEIWIGSYTTGTPAQTYFYPAKFKAGSNIAITASNYSAITEYHMMLRLGEQYLIRAEARAMNGNIAGAVADLNILRTRARATPTVAVPNPLPDLSTSLTQDQVMAAVMQERRVELFSEWGHRWLDLKRAGKVNAVMSVQTPLKGGTWQSTDQLYPLPAEDLVTNSNLVQNPGY